MPYTFDSPFNRSIASTEVLGLEQVRVATIDIITPEAFGIGEYKIRVRFVLGLLTPWEPKEYIEREFNETQSLNILTRAASTGNIGKNLEMSIYQELEDLGLLPPGTTT